MRYTTSELWQYIQLHPDFCNFSGTDSDLRDNTKENPALSIDLKKGQWYDHNTGEGGGLYELSKSLNALPEEEKKMLNSFPTARKQTATTDSTPKKGTTLNQNDIWQKANQDDDAVKLYFTQGRSIPENHYADIYRLFRVAHFNGLQVIHPYFSFDSWQSELCGKPFDVPRIQRIWFDASGHKTDKKHFGKTGKTSVCFPIPPHNKNRDSKKAVILEGIENALSLRANYSASWIFVATCKSGLKRLPEFMKNYEEVLILADHDFDSVTFPDKSNHPTPDKTGQAEAWELAETLKKQAYTLGKHNFSCKAIMPRQTGKDANDALRAAQLPEFIATLIDIPEKFQSADDSTGENTDLFEWSTPKEITAELLPVEELTPEMIPEPLRDWLTDIAHRMQVPLDFSATACVVMLSSIIGTRLSIRPKKNDSWQVIPNLWGALIQRPSQLKSPPVQEVFKVLDKLEAESFKQNEDAEKTYQNENRKFEMKQKIYEDNLRKAMKKGDDLEVGSAENELEILESEPPDKPTTRRYQTQDATPEKLQDLLSVNPQGILVFRDELNGFLMSLEKEGHETARAFYLEGWNGGGSFTLDRITRGTVRSNLICISLFGTIQPAKIIPHIRKAKSETGNDGLFQRFQIAVYPDAVKWSYIDKIPNQSAHSRAFKLIRRLTEMNFREHDSVQNEGDGIPFMKFSAEAQDLFESWIKHLETNKLNNLDEAPSLLEHFGKYRSLMPSLALIFHLLEIADSNRSGNVSLQATQQAAQWCEYLEKHARRIYGMAEDIIARAAGSLSKKIKNGNLEDNFTAREVHRKGWELLTEIETVNAALTDLVEANWLREIPILPTEKGGRKTMNYQINPEIKKSEIL